MEECGCACDDDEYEEGHHNVGHDGVEGPVDPAHHHYIDQLS